MDTQPRHTGDVSVEAGRAPSQPGWYRYAAQKLAPGKHVLDAGCGMGVGLRDLQLTAAYAMGQDLDPRLGRHDVMITPLSNLPEKSFDVVTAIDVVEHVDDDVDFVRELARIARETVFLTTPISVRGKELGPYHVREYTPRMLHDLVRSIGPFDYLKGSSRGDEVYPVKNLPFFWIENWAMNSAVLNVPFRAAQKLLPRRSRYTAHHAVIVHLE